MYEQILGERPSGKYWPCFKRRFSKEELRAVWVNVEQLLRGAEMADYSKSKGYSLEEISKVKPYHAGRSESRAVRGIDFIYGGSCIDIDMIEDNY